MKFDVQRHHSSLTIEPKFSLTDFETLLVLIPVGAIALSLMEIITNPALLSANFVPLVLLSLLVLYAKRWRARKLQKEFPIIYVYPERRLLRVRGQSHELLEGDHIELHHKVVARFNKPYMEMDEFHDWYLVLHMGEEHATLYKRRIRNCKWLIKLAGIISSEMGTRIEYKGSFERTDENTYQERVGASPDYLHLAK